MIPICRSRSSRRGEAEARTRNGVVTRASPAQVQHANQRKQAPRRVVVDGNFVGQPLHQQRRPLVVQRPLSYVDRFYLSEVRVANCLVIAFTDHEVVSDDAAKRGEWQENGFARTFYRRANNNAQPVLFDCQMQVEWAVVS